MKISSKNYTPSKMKYHYKSPAKINLFLNIIKKRKDGFHDIQSIFQLIDLHDELTFIKKNNNHINFSCNLKTLEQNNSIINTIEVFRKKFSIKKIGLDIILKKNIPIGAGLGGGSSNVATTLAALSYIFNINIKKSELIKLGLSLGCDVPFFINSSNAWVEGKGEVLTNLYLEPCWFLMIFSNHSIITKNIYDLVKIPDAEEIHNNYDDYLAGKTGNIFENIVFKKYPSIKKAHALLSEFGHARMSGTGGTVFLKLNSLEDAKKIMKSIPKNYRSLIVKSLTTEN